MGLHLWGTGRHEAENLGDSFEFSSRSSLVKNLQCEAQKGVERN